VSSRKYFCVLQVSLPAASVLSNLCTNVDGVGVGVVAALWTLNSKYYFSYVLFVSLVHFCNFTQLNCWMKSVLATFTGIIFIAVIASQVMKATHCKHVLINVQEMIVWGRTSLSWNVIP